MIQFSRNSSTKSSTQDAQTPKSSYSHFKRVLKSRQKFPSSSSHSHLHSEPTLQTSSPRNKISQFFQMAIRKKLEQDTPIEDIQTKKANNYYSLENIPYKNYKYEKPPGTATISDFLEQACRLGQKTGRWDKQLLIEKFNPSQPEKKRSTYTSDHLIKSRKVQGPASCLETIYVAKLQLDLEQNYNEQFQNKINEIEGILQQGVKDDKTACASQQYILNRWTRKQVTTEKKCNKGDKLPQFAHQKWMVDQSINKVIKSSSQYTNHEQTPITQLPERISFQKFDFKLKNYSRQSYLNYGQTIELLKEYYPFLNKPIIGNRLLLSFGLLESQQNVPYQTFIQFIQIYDGKKNRAQEVANDMVTKNARVSQVLKFFVIDLDEDITTQEYANLIRILCEQLSINHPSTKSIYDELIQNYKIHQIISENLQEPMNKKQFKFIYSTNQMNIDDIIDLITVI